MAKIISTNATTPKANALDAKKAAVLAARQAPKAQVIPENILEDDENVDLMEQELEEATAEKAPKKKREAIIGANQIGAHALADMLGTTPFKLRGFLRKYFRDMATEKGKTYVWEKDSEELQAIVDAYNARKDAPRATSKKSKKAEETDDEDLGDSPVSETNDVSLDDLDLEDDME